MKKLVFLICAIAVVFFCSWGFLVHRTTTQLAVYELPKPMRAFFHENLPYLTRYSVRPDQRRNEDSTEAPKHILDAELYGDSAVWKMPYDFREAIAKYGWDSLKRNGYVVYWVPVMKDNLTRAFARRDRDSIIFYAADLAHYIGDAHVPLHITENYDGQLTNQKGLHSLWESMVPEIQLADLDLRSFHKAKYISDPQAEIWKVVRTSFQLVPRVLAEEKNASAGFTDSTKFRIQIRNGRESKGFTTAFAKAYYAKLGEMINRQLIRTSDMIADFWYTSWVDGGRPDLKELIKTSNSIQYKQWKTEKRSFKRNHLLPDSLLYARRPLENN
jgi:hypothetical protein